MKQYEELYINGQQVNIGDTNITLEWKSVIFSDISKYVASHSYTIKVPMTEHNRQVFKAFEMPERSETGEVKGVVGKRLSARYICNGVDLLGDANAYLTGTDGESYKIALTWNALTGFKAMNEEEKKIPELLGAKTQNINVVPYEDRYSSFINGNLIMNVAALDYYNGATPVRYIGTLPSFKVTWIMARLLDYYGIPHNIDPMVTNEDEDELLESLYCPMVTLNDSEGMQKYTMFRVNFAGSHAADGHVGLLVSSFVNINTFYSTVFLNERVQPLVHGDRQQYYKGWVGKRELMKYKVRSHIRVFISENAIDTGTSVKTSLWLEAFLLQNVTLELLNGEHEGNGSSTLSIKPTYVSGEWRRRLGGGKTEVFYELRFENVEDEETSVSDDLSEDVKFSSIERFKILRRARYFMIKGVSSAFFYDLPAYDIDNATLYSITTNAAPGSYDNYADVTPCLSEGSYIEPYSDDKLVGYDLYVEPNLPDMKPMEFFKGVLRLAGMFPYVVDGQLRFARYGKIIENIPSALDWSDFVMDDPVLPKSTSLSISGFNKRNWMRYKDDDENNPRYSGYFDIDDESLTKVDDLFTLPFTSDGQTEDGRAVVPVFTTGTIQMSYSMPVTWMGLWLRFFWMGVIEDIAGYVFKEIKPHIGRRVPSSYWTLPLTAQNLTTKNLDTLSFDGLSFSDPNSEVRKRYRVFEEILKTPYIIKVSMDIDEITLRDLDFTVPVYLRQYSSYFGIISIKRKSDGECTVELVRIPNTLIK